MLYVGDVGQGLPDQSREVIGYVLARRVVGELGTVVEEGGPGWGWGGQNQLFTIQAILLR